MKWQSYRSHQIFLHFSRHPACADFGIKCINSVDIGEDGKRLGLEVEPPPKKISKACDVTIEEIFCLSVLYWNHLQIEKLRNLICKLQQV